MKMKIKINLELIKAPPENGTYHNDIHYSLCEGCFFQWAEDGCLLLTIDGKNTAGSLCTQGKDNFIWKEIGNGNENN